MKSTTGKSLSLTVILLLILTCINYVITARAPPPPNVQINKCCRIGESIDNQLQCVLPATEKWVPHVFLIKKNEYFTPKGSAPRFLQIRENTFPPGCTNPELFVGANVLAIFSNGSLFISEKSYLVLSTDDYCVDKDAALVCLPQLHGADHYTAMQKIVKVKKCCGQNAAYKRILGTCVIIDDNHPVYDKHILNQTSSSSSIEITYGFPQCNIEPISYSIIGKFHWKTFNETTGSIHLDNGVSVAAAATATAISSSDGHSHSNGGGGGDDVSVMKKITGDHHSLTADQYCLEHTFHDLGSDVNIFTCDDHRFITATVTPSNYENIRSTIYALALLISVKFLIATLATGFLLPSNHHLLHWRCQTYYVVCLLVGDLLLAPIQYYGKSIELGPICNIMAIAMHFFFLAAFFWLNTMCFNIWWTFRDFRPTSLEKGQEVVRLRIYSIYAWGGPTLIAGIAAILDYIPQDPSDNFLRPRFGENKCWFFGDMEMLIYFFGPIGILLIINVLLFASTARQLTCGLWKRDDVKSTTERAALGRVCLKLVIVMGVTWVADVISWAVGGPHYMWYFTDVINALHGVFIFIVVGCQPQIWTAAKRLWSVKTGRGVTNTTNGPQHSSSSHGLPSIGESVTNNTFTNTTSTNKVPMETIC